MNALIVYGVGVLAMLSLVMLMVGYRQFRTNSLEHLAAEDLVLLKGSQRRRAEGDSPLRRLARRQVPALRKLLGPARVKSLQGRIDEAGRPDGMTVDSYLETTVWWMILILPVVFLFAIQGQFLMIALCLTIPVLMPLSRLATAQRKRRQRVDRDLPDFLDVLAVTVMAGVNFRSAIGRVALQFKGPLAEEMDLTMQQIANGATMRSAFTALRERSSSEAVGQFVSALLQSQELGAPLAESLKQIAEDMRRESGQQQRREAAKSVPRVTLVTSMVLVPGVMIFIMVGLIVGSDVDFGSLLEFGQ